MICGKAKKKSVAKIKRKIIRKNQHPVYIFCIIVILYTEIITKRNLIVLSCN